MVSSDEIVYQDEYVLLTSGKIRVGSLFLEGRRVRFADVVRQDYPMRRNVLLVGGWFTLLFWLISLAWGGWAFFLILALVELGIGYAGFRRKYALRIGYDLGTVKALITSDRVYLQKVKQMIDRALMMDS